MIHRRHSLIFDPQGESLNNELKEDGNVFLSMGEGEKNEVLPKKLLIPRTWWRTCLKFD